MDLQLDSRTRTDYHSKAEEFARKLARKRKERSMKFVPIDGLTLIGDSGE